MSTTAVAPATVRRWWRTIADHRPVQLDSDKPPRCPLCNRRKCRPWADAFGELVAADVFHLGPTR